MMATVRTYLFLTMAIVLVSKMACGGILGHSGLVIHVDKHGHWSGHSSHYDYRFYPEKSLLGYLMDHHNSIDDHRHHLANEAYDLIPDIHGYHDPYFHFQNEHHIYH